MLLAAILGAIAGGVTTIVWWCLQFLISNTAAGSWVGAHAYLVPLAMAGLVALYLSQKSTKRSSDVTDALADLTEEFHFGIQRSEAGMWGLRSMVSAMGSFFVGIFGVEACVVEGTTAVLQTAVAKFPRSFHRVLRHDFEVRQILVDGTLAGTFSVMLGAPFAGGLLTLECLMISATRVRIAAFTSALAAYGAWKFLSYHMSVENFALLPSLLTGYRPVGTDAPQLVVTSIAAAFTGVLVAGLSIGFGYAHGSIRDALVKLKFTPVKLTLMIGALMSALIALTPELFSEPWRVWTSMSWLQISSSGATLQVVARAILLLLGLMVFGSTGILTPLLFLAALVGYSVGSAFNMEWALPLAFAGASAALVSTFGAPLAAAALVYEVSGDGHLWWFGLLATVSAVLVTRYFGENPLLSNLLAKRNIRLVNGRCTNVLADIQMKDAMVKDISILTDTATLAELQKAAGESQYNVLGVCAEDGDFRGLLSLDQLPNNADLRGISTRDLLDSDAIEVKPSDPLEDAFDLLTSVPALAVVDSQRRLLGLVFKTHLIARYHRELGRRALQYYTSRK